MTDDASSSAVTGASAPAARTRRVRLGYLGPAIVLLGAAFAAIAIWFMQSQRPVPGDVIDTFTIDPARSIIVRKEATSDRSFIELRERGELKWRALIPHYAGERGRPAVAWGERSVTVRVSRHGRAEVFAFALDGAQKLGTLKLAPEHSPIETHGTGPITLTDHVRSYEIVAGETWQQLIAIDLSRGEGVWKVDLDPAPVKDAVLERNKLWLTQGTKRVGIDVMTGQLTPDAPVAR